MIKRLLSGVVALAITFTMTGVSVLAHDTKSADNVYEAEKEMSEENVSNMVSGDWQYTVRDDGMAKITAFLSKETVDVVIPSQIDGYTVTELDRDLFEGNYTIESITIPATIKYMKDGAVAGAGNLKTIVVEAGNTAYKVVDGVLFNMDGTSLLVYPAESENVVYSIPEGVEYIGKNAFKNAFYLEYIIMPDSVVDTGQLVFWGCTQLKDIRLSKNLTCIEAYNFYCVQDNLKRFTIPDNIAFMNIYAFGQCWELEEIKLPQNLKSIGMGMFEYCMSLKNVVIPEGVEDIQSYAFEGCEELSWIAIPRSVKEIKSNSFAWCDMLTDVYYGGTKEEWEDINGSLTNKYLTGATIHYNCSVQGLVERMYTNALGREADEAGFINWVNTLKNDERSGAAMAAEFILGEEFMLRGLSNEEFVDVLYKTFFGREADEQGRDFWITTLDAGFTREYVLSQFVNLDEFKRMCDVCEIERGIMFENGVAASQGIVCFVDGLYKNVLGRSADGLGMHSWALVLTLKAESAYSVAYNFLNSEEYIAQNTDSKEYVSTLYKVFMNRSADAAGLIAWSAAIDAGMPRNDVLAAFAGSEEFAIIAAGYGLSSR